MKEDGELVATDSLVGGEILAVFVHPRLQKSGRGKALMKALENEARAAGVTEIGLSISLPLKAVLRESRLQGRRRQIERCRRRSAVGLLESREAVIQFMIRNATDGACTETKTSRRVAFSTSSAIGCRRDKHG